MLKDRYQESNISLFFSNLTYQLWYLTQVNIITKKKRVKRHDIHTKEDGSYGADPVSMDQSRTTKYIESISLLS